MFSHFPDSRQIEEFLHYLLQWDGRPRHPIGPIIILKPITITTTTVSIIIE
jgi:hypothetical protein